MMKRRKVLKSSYGRVVLIKRFCPNCKNYAIVIQDNFCCCGTKIGDWQGEFKIRRKRESEVPGKRVSISKKDKEKTLRYQNRQCIYCGSNFDNKKIHIEYDHFIPFCFSGNNHVLNMVAACRQCNQIKSAYLFSSIEEARILILQEREKRGLPWSDYCGGSYEVSKI